MIAGFMREYEELADPYALPTEILARIPGFFTH
jgi:hypothetical protein